MSLLLLHDQPPHGPRPTTRAKPVRRRRGPLVPLLAPPPGAAAPVARSAAGDTATGSTASGTNVVVAKPTNTADGDVLVAVVFSSLTAANWTPPVGWTQQAGENTSRSVYLFTKPIPSASAELPTTYTFAWSGGSGRGLGIIFRVTGCPTLAPIIDSVGAATTAGSTSIVAPADITVQAPTLLVGAWFSADATTNVPVITPPASMAVMADVQVAPAASSDLTVSAETISSAGSTGTRTASVSPAASSGVGGFLVAFAPGPPVWVPVQRRPRTRFPAVRRPALVVPPLTQALAPANPVYVVAPARRVMRAVAARRPRPVMVPAGQAFPVGQPGRPRRTWSWRRRPAPPVPVPGQVAAPVAPQYPTTAQRPRRVMTGARRATTPAPVPAQQAATPPPPYPVWVFRTHRVVTGLRRSGVPAPVPPQGVAPAPPPVVPQLRTARRLQSVLRRARPVAPAPAQAVVVAPVYPRQPVRRRLVALLLRRGNRVRFPPQPGNVNPTLPKVGRVAPGRLGGAAIEPGSRSGPGVEAGRRAGSSGVPGARPGPGAEPGRRSGPGVEGGRPYGD